MENHTYDWLYSIVRIAGSSFPLTSSLVQLQAEIDSGKIKERLNKLEDPIRRFLLKNIPSCMSFFPSSALCQSPNTLSMQTLARLEYEKKSCSIWYILFRQSPKFSP